MPSRPVVSKPARRAYSVPTSKPDATIRQSSSWCSPTDDDAGRVDALDAPSVGVDQVDVRPVVRVEVLVVEARPLAELAVPRLERVGGARVADDGVDSGPDLVHLLVVAVLVGSTHRLGGELGALLTQGEHHPVADALRDVGPAVLDQVDVGEPTGLERRAKFSCHSRCQPGPASRTTPGRWPVAAHVDRRRRALEDEQLAGVTGEMRDALHRSRTGADDADAPVARGAPSVHRTRRRRCSRSPSGWCGTARRRTSRCPAIPGSFGRWSGPVPIETKRAAEARRRGWSAPPSGARRRATAATGPASRTGRRRTGRTASRCAARGRRSRPPARTSRCGT